MFLNKQTLRFLVGGGSAVLTDYLTYRLFLSLGIPLSGAKALSFFCGSAVGFVINKLWTFESRGTLRAEIPRYAALYLCTACINSLVNRGVLAVLDIQILGFLCATGVSTVLNFLGLKFIVFRDQYGP